MVDALLWPGTVGPDTTTPPRAAGSVRRTSSVDAFWPDGMSGPLVLRGRARDLRTTPDGRAEVLGEATLRVTIDTTAGRTVTALDATPSVPGVDSLVGVRVGSGFRNALDAAAGHLTAHGELLGLLLDEVPVVALISGASVSRALAGGDRAAEQQVRAAMAQRRKTPVDICAGWVRGGTLEQISRSTGPRGLVGHEPTAPRLEDPADPLGWHALEPLPAGGVRRRRRLDVTRGQQPDEVTVAGIFRDTYTEANTPPSDGAAFDGPERILHEYGVTATIDSARNALTTVDAVPHVLPGAECPLAADSAGRLVGRSLDGLRDRVRAEFGGVTTCTHLTDQLRALADVHALTPLLIG